MPVYPRCRVKRKKPRSSNKPDAGHLTPSKTNATGSFLSRSPWLFALLLIAATFVAYLPVLHAGFIWDDDAHISSNQALYSWTGLRQIWTTPGATMQYYPLSFTVFWVDYHLWGLQPMGYHLQNVLLHSLAAILLWQTLKRLRVQGAWLAGAIFALHPVNVMSVAWATELKNTLAGTLVLAAFWAYLRFAGLGVYDRGGKDGTSTAPDWRFYFLSLALFQLALFAKTAVSFLPITLLLVLWWQRSRWRWNDVWPVLPMFGMGMLIGQVTFYVEHHSGGATGNEFNFDGLHRLLVSGRSFWFYLEKLFCPRDLAFIYPRWHIDPGIWWQWLFPLATAGVLVGSWLMRDRLGKGLFVALLHFYVSTSMLILLVVLFMTRYSFVSDHWQYFGCMSIIALAAAGMAAGLRTLVVFRGTAGALLLVLGLLTWRQCAMYSNLETLWRVTLSRNPDSAIGHISLGCILAERGQVDAAVGEYRKGIELRPDQAEGYNNLGLVFFKKGQWDEARIQYQKVLEIQPDNADAQEKLGVVMVYLGRADEAIAFYQDTLKRQPDNAYLHNNLGSVLLQQGRWDEAVMHYQKAVELQPRLARAHYNLAQAWLRNGRQAEAIVEFQKVIEISPDDLDAHNDLGCVLLQQDRGAEAASHFREILGIKPDDAVAHFNLANALTRAGRIGDAVTHYQRSLELKPDSADVCNNFAWVLVTSPEPSIRNGARAVALAEKANELLGTKNPAVLCTLGAAYAEAGRFTEALATAGRALPLAAAEKNDSLVNVLQGQIKLYQAGSPYRDSSLAERP